MHVDLGWIQDEEPSEADASDPEFEAMLAAMSMASGASNEEAQRMQFFDQLAEAASLLDEPGAEME